MLNDEYGRLHNKAAASYHNDVSIRLKETLCQQPQRAACVDSQFVSYCLLVKLFVDASRVIFIIIQTFSHLDFC